MSPPGLTFPNTCLAIFARIPSPLFLQYYEKPRTQVIGNGPNLSLSLIARKTDTLGKKMNAIGTATQVVVFLLLIVSRVQESSALSTQNSNRGANTSSRRRFVEGIASAAAGAGMLLPEQAHATRAVGGAEIECRAAGNCLEKFELDGALGWNWGAKDRCDATDPNCGPDGKLRDNPSLVIRFQIRWVIPSPMWSKCPFRSGDRTKIVLSDWACTETTLPRVSRSF